MDVNTDVDGDDEANLTWIAREENAYPLEYYLDQENNSDKSEDKDKDYSDGSLLLLDIIEGQFNRYPIPFSPPVFCYRFANLTLFKGIASIYERILPG
jgi:hypothetical protein